MYDDLNAEIKRLNIEINRLREENTMLRVRDDISTRTIYVLIRRLNRPKWRHLRFWLRYWRAFDTSNMTEIVYMRIQD